MEFVQNALHFLGIVRRMIIYSGLRRAELSLACAVENGSCFQIKGSGMLRSIGPS